MNSFGAVLSVSQVRPFEIDEVVAGWDSVDGEEISSGYVVKLLSGEFVYIVARWNDRLRMTRTATRYFAEEPTWLYTERLENWNRNKDALNADLPWSKAQAKYPTPDRESGGSACARPVLRIPATQPGTAG